MIRRIAGVLVRPRATLAELIKAPAWVATWLVILVVWAACGGWLLSTDIGRQAVVDERVRVIETFGGTVTDAQYAALQARAALVGVFHQRRADVVDTAGNLDRLPWACGWSRVWSACSASLSQALALVVHASVVLLVGQLVATPLHYVRESLTSPLNLAAILPLMEEGTVPTRFFGTMDFFALWWMGLLALGLSVLTGRRPGRYLLAVAALYASFAAVVAALIAVIGGA